MSKNDLLKKLSNPIYREEFLSSEIDMGLPMQLRAMREKRGWKQSFVAEKTNTKQPRFSLMEKPGYGNFSLSTLKKLASIFDVGLIVSFVPWGEMIDFVESLSHKRLEIPSFDGEFGESLDKPDVSEAIPVIGYQQGFCTSTFVLGGNPLKNPSTTQGYQRTTSLPEIQIISPTSIPFQTVGGQYATRA